MAADKEEYDIEAYAEKVRKALKRMQETTTAGVRTGKGRRMDVMRAVKADIETLVALGYTAGQIADAISKGDVFAILPKSITQLLNESSKSSKAESTSGKKAEGTTGLSQKRAAATRDTTTKNKPPTSKDDGLAVANPSEEPNETASEDPPPTDGGRTGPRPDRD